MTTFYIARSALSSTIEEINILTQLAYSATSLAVFTIACSGIPPRIERL